MLLFRVKMTANNFPSVKAFQLACKKSYEVMGLHWYEKFLPLHFRREAKTKYGYQPRASKYLKHKRALGKSNYGKRPKYGGEVDEVWSGDLEEKVKSYVSVRGFPTRASITMSAPRYVSMRPYKSGHPNIGEEITTVTQTEATELTKIFDAELQTEMDNANEFWTDPNN